jgi:cell division protein FtsW (lipid II flippase)
VWECALLDYQRNRVLAFINPALDPSINMDGRLNQTDA